MSIFSDLIGGRINALQAVAKVIPYIQRLTSIGGGVETPQPPASPSGAADQIETVEEALKGYVHAYITAKLGTGLAGQLTQRVVDGALQFIITAVEAAIHGAAAAKAG